MRRATATEMDLLGTNAKRRKSEDLGAGDGEARPGATEAPEEANPGPTPPPPDAGGGGAGGGGGDDEDGVDRISSLPDAVLGEIVSLLSTKEAGRTQILASRWRHVWLASPLVLDGADLYNKPKALLSDSDSSEDSDSDDDERTFTASFEALACAVDHILSAHPGPVRRFCIPSLYLHDRAANVDAWLSSPALDNLQELDFWERFDTKWYVKSYPLPPPPASTFRFSGTLRVATLSKCNMDSSVEGIHFPHLKQLGLERVIISEGSLHTLISRCLVLECLLFKDNIGLGCLQISSSSLRSIAVGAHPHPYFKDPKLKEVIIADAPCLERILSFDVRAKGFNAIDLTVFSAPKLETLGVIKENVYVHPRLVIGTTAIQGLNVVSMSTPLSNVKILAVASWPRINLDTVIDLLKCFPCLVKLYIKSCISGGMNRWRRKHRDFIRSFDIRLKTIVLEEYRGTSPQVNFASFFLLNAGELESMQLQVEFTDYNDAFFTEQHEKLQMEKRASRGARLHFTKRIRASHVHVNHVRDLSMADPFECRC